MTIRKKLIEVALPLEAINKESAREKSIRHGHPSTLHQWWARRPLAACRAVLFGSLVDDPSSHPDKFPTEDAQERERQRLFRIIEELVKWENINDEAVLNAARTEIMKSTDGTPPPVLDPFCGGGSIPLEAQRLGLKAYGSDLNPVAVLITKALIEIPPSFAGRPPVNPEATKKMANTSEWRGAAGLADDVRYYGKWMRDEAEKRIGHLYPKAKLSKEYGGGEASVIAWLWARTIKCPNPACGATMPLVRSFWLSNNKGKLAWIEPIVDRRLKTIRFEVKLGHGSAPSPTKTGRGSKFKCMVCDETTEDTYVKSEGMAGRMGFQLMAIAVEGEGGRVYVPSTSQHVATAASAVPVWKPTEELPDYARGAFWCKLYGLLTWGDLFTKRQLVALSTLSDLIIESHEIILKDAINAGINVSKKGEQDAVASAYADAIVTYLALALDKLADLANSLCLWEPIAQCPRNLFARQAVPMQWNFAEGNPLGRSSGSWEVVIDNLYRNINSTLVAMHSDSPGTVTMADARGLTGEKRIVSTDPPYYDNIGYADLSDFFYVWLRRSLSKIYPQLFGTVQTPKSEELIVAVHRLGRDKLTAKQFFEDGLTQVFGQIRGIQADEFPVTIFYAFRQTENQEDDSFLDTLEIAGHVSTGWETMLEGLLKSGFEINGTWPVRTEMITGLKRAFNNLASSIVLVCRPRPENAPLATRREFIGALRRELPDALKKLQQGYIAPVDFAQAAIGPGMGIFSRYSKILEADGTPMSVRTALQLINQELEAFFAEQEGDLDADTRFCVSWFEQKGMEEGAFGEADVLARAKNTSVQGLVDAGVAKAKSGKVRLLKRDELEDDWNPIRDSRITVWECTQYLIRALEQGGEEASGKLAAQLGGGRSEDARALSYRLYSICERKGWAQEALAYNSIVASWGEVQAKTAAISSLTQQHLGSEFSAVKQEGKTKKVQKGRSR